MTDLELITRFAEIEGLPPVNQDNFGYYLIQEVVTRGNSATKGIMTRYNPLTDKALLWDAMVKYEVVIDWYNQNVCIYSYRKDRIAASCDFEDNSDIPRAIIECIVKAHDNA